MSATTTYAHAGAHPVSVGARGQRRAPSGGSALAPSRRRRCPKGPRRARARGVRTPPPVELQAQPVIDLKRIANELHRQTTYTGKRLTNNENTISQKKQAPCRETWQDILLRRVKRCRAQLRATQRTGVAPSPSPAKLSASLIRQRITYL